MSRAKRGPTKRRQTVVLPDGRTVVRDIRGVSSNAYCAADFGALREGGKVHIATRKWGQDAWEVSSEEHSRPAAREDRVGKLTAEDWAWLREETLRGLRAGRATGTTPSGLVAERFDSSLAPINVCLLSSRTMGHLAWKLLAELQKAGLARTELGTGLRGGEARYFVHVDFWRD